MAYSDTVLGLTPASYWKLDETEGTTATDQQSAFAGTYFDAGGLVLGQTRLVYNDSGYAPLLDDNFGDYIVIGNAYDFTGTSNFTIVTWINLGEYNATNGHFIASNYHPSEGGWYWNLGNPAVTFQIGRVDSGGASDVFTYTASEASVEGSTHMVAAWYDGSNIKMYMDGAFVGTPVASTRSVAADTTNNSLRFGAYSAGGSAWDGRLDEIAVWTSALSEANLDLLYRAGRSRTYKRLAGPAQLSASAADLYTCPASTVTRILGIHASNPSGSPVDINLSIGTDAAGTRVYDDFEIPADSVETNFDPYELAAGEKIQGWASTAGTVVVTVSGYEDPV